jgi:hypothetical protein
MKTIFSLLTVCGLLAMPVYAGTQTENYGISVLPAPGKVVIDGRFDDWDLTGGNFACENVEEQRDQHSAWLHAMYDQDNLYVLARVTGSFRHNDRRPAGSTLRMHMLTAPGTPQQLQPNLTCARDLDGKESIALTFEPPLQSARDPKQMGAEQVFLDDPGGKGYSQEIRIPLKMITSEGVTPGPGSEMRVMFVLPFGWSLDAWDCFMPGVVPERTYWGTRKLDQFGPATFERSGKMKPRMLHLADGRRLPVSLKEGMPVVDWSALSEGPKGFIPVKLTMPEDGYVSMLLRNADGVVVRNLLNAEPMAMGEHTVSWDGLATPIWRTPGAMLPADDYTWQAIWHKGIGLRLRGWAGNSGNAPWHSGPTSNWGGDLGVPWTCAAQGDSVYLGWGAAEAGRGLLACDLEGNVRWKHKYGGFGGADLLAVEGDLVYVGNNSGSPQVLFRLDTATGSYQNWDKANNGGFRDLFVKDLWKDQPGMPDKAEAMAARNGKLYLTFRSYNFRRSDVTNWRALLTKLSAAGDGIGKAIWEKTDKNVRERAAAWLAGNDPEDKALAAPNYYTPDVRDAVAGTINGMLTDKTLVDGGAEMTALMLQAAVRRKVEAVFPQEVAVMKSDLVAVLDAENGKVLKTIPVPAPSGIVAVSDSLLYVLSGTDSVTAVDLATGAVKPVLTGLTDARCLAVDAGGRIYVGEGEPSVQVKVFMPNGKPGLTIGRQGGRPRLGPWVKEGMVDIHGLAVDPTGNLWVAESTFFPKRFSVWNNQTGAFVREFFGSTHYGASGGAINPDDPNLMVGEGCEWRIDPATGRAECLGVFEDGAGRDYENLFHKFARFCRGTNGKLYLAATLGTDTHVWERLGDGTYALRATFGRNDKDKTTVFWSDENGDQQKQDGEKTVVPMLMSFNGYLNFSLGLNTDLTLYAGVLDPKTNRWDRGARIRLAGFTPCGAPKWDHANLHFLPPLEGPMPSPANDLVLSCDSENRLFNCYDVASGKLRWSYPNTFHGVHGSHNAPGPQAGLIRGAFGTVGSVTLPDPVGSAWVINSNVGEWHMLTRDGFYLTRLFQGDFSKVQWPEKAVPGAVLDHVPAGEGGEDFGGSITQAKDGKLYVTAGKTANWNVEVVGLETVKPLDSGTLRLEEKDLKLAEAIRSELVQRSVGQRRCEVRKQTPVFTGDLAKDFGKEIVFKKQDDAEVRSAIAWDDTFLYLGWRVADATPWTNGADSPEFMYARGDTMDFQLGTDPEADENRAEAAMGDLRLSIGDFRGKPTAVLYRKIAEQKNPRTFSSGVVSNYVMDSVVELQDAKIEVKKGDRWYVVEIAVPLATLGLKPFAGMKLSGDFGATHGTPAGDDTLLRTYWNNQATGLVNDEVFELKMEPKNWGQILFTE